MNTNTLTFYSGLMLSIAFAAANVSIGILAGITPNMSIAGLFIGWIALRILNRNRARITTHINLNLLQTGTSAGNASASAVAFTLPALAIAGIAVESVDYARLVLAIGGGISTALLIVPRMVRREPNRPDSEFPPEADAIVGLIGRLVESASDLRTRRQVITAILLAATCGILTGLAKAPILETSLKPIWPTGAPFSASTYSISINLAWVALGAIVGIDASRQIFGGAVMRLILVTAAIGASHATRSRMGHDTSTNGYFDAHWASSLESGLSGVAAVVLLCGGGVALVGHARSVLFQRKEEKGTTNHEQQRYVGDPVRTPIALIVVAILGMFAPAWHDFETTSLVSSMLTCGLMAVLSVFLAERVASIVGVSVNPSSAVSLFTAMVLLSVCSMRLSILTILICAFVTSAASAAADIAQDLWIGRKLTPSVLSQQIQLKWIGGILAIPVVVLFASALLNTIQEKSRSAPQAKAIEILTNTTSENTDIDDNPNATLRTSWKHSRYFIGLVGVALFGLCVCARSNPIMLGIGMLVSPTLSLPLLIGGIFAKLTRNHMDASTFKLGMAIIVAMMPMGRLLSALSACRTDSATPLNVAALVCFLGCIIAVRSQRLDSNQT